MNRWTAPDHRSTLRRDHESAPATVGAARGRGTEGRTFDAARTLPDTQPVIAPCGAHVLTRLRFPSVPDDHREHLMPHTYAVDAAAEFLTIDREQRDALWEEASCDLSAVGDLSIMLQRGPSDYDLSTRRRIARALHLLDDLGWDRYEDPRSEYHLSVPASWLPDWLQDCITSQLDGALACQELAARGEYCGEILSYDEIREQEQGARERRRRAATIATLLERLTGQAVDLDELATARAA